MKQTLKKITVITVGACILSGCDAVKRVQKHDFLLTENTFIVNGKNNKSETLSKLSFQKVNNKFLGVPFNISSYSLLTCMIAQVCGLDPGEFVWTGGDCHLYLNHMEQAKIQIQREPLELPTLQLEPSIMSIDEFRYEHITIEGYDHHPHISAPISV